jgi:hypothetical protein
MSAPLAVLWQVDRGAIEAGGFRWGHSGSDVVAEWTGVLTLRATAGGELAALETVPGARPEVVEKVRSGPVAAFLRGLAGRPSLHASGVAVGGGAALFVGPSGAGKSTLAASLCGGTGAALLADDMIGLEMEGSHWRAIPSESVLWLAAGGEEKRPVRSGDAARAPVPIRWVFSLRFDDPLSGVTFRRVRAAEAASALLGAMVRFDAEPSTWMRELDVAEGILDQARVCELIRPRTIDPEKVARAVRDHLGREDA